MKNSVISVLFLILSVHLLSAQTSTGTIVVNNKNDITTTSNEQIISFYLKGLTAQQINGFSNKITTINGMKLFFLKITDENLKVSHGKIQLQNEYNRKGLVKLLKQYNIKTIVIAGVPSDIDDFFAKKEGGIIIK